MKRFLQIMNYLLALILAFTVAKFYLLNGHTSAITIVSMIAIAILLVAFSYLDVSRRFFFRKLFMLIGIQIVLIVTTKYFMGSSFTNMDVLLYKVSVFVEIAMFLVSVAGWFLINDEDPDETETDEVDEDEYNEFAEEVKSTDNKKVQHEDDDEDLL